MGGRQPRIAAHNNKTGMSRAERPGIAVCDNMGNRGANIEHGGRSGADVAVCNNMSRLRF